SAEGQGVPSCNGFALSMRCTSADSNPHCQEKPMRMLTLIPTLLVIGSTAVTAQGADLTKIDRTIAKEPTYKSNPKYCLLVFGPEAKMRVWLVLDGDVLYVDRNGNGDLTEEGERLVAARKTWVVGVKGRIWTVGDVAAPGGKVIYKGLTVSDVSEVVDS